MGIRPGPSYAVYLNRLLDARMDGLVNDKEGEDLLLAEIVSEAGEEDQLN